MSLTPLIKATFTGKDIKPGLMRSKDIAEVIATMEDIVATMIINEHSDIDIRKDSIVLGLNLIEEGSVALGFVTNDFSLANGAMESIKSAFLNETLTSLPFEIRKGFERIISVAKKYETILSVNRIADDDLLFSLSPDTEMPYAAFISGETTIYGEITRTGGADTPRIQFRNINGQTIYCDASKRIAVQAGKRLYTQVAIKGMADWDIESGEILNFTIEEILEEYEPISPCVAFRELSNAFGDAFQDVHDVEDFISEMRKG